MWSRELVHPWFAVLLAFTSWQLCSGPAAENQGDGFYFFVGRVFVWLCLTIEAIESAELIGRFGGTLGASDQHQ
jgi:hypothetical protein